VSFSNAKIASESEKDESTAVTKAEENVKDIANRFVGSTSQIVNVDHHMFAFPMTTSGETIPATNQSRTAYIDKKWRSVV